MTNCYTYSSVHQMESVGAVPLELGVPELQSIVCLGLGQCSILWPGHLPESIYSV